MAGHLEDLGEGAEGVLPHLEELIEVREYHRLRIEGCLSGAGPVTLSLSLALSLFPRDKARTRIPAGDSHPANNYFTEMCSGSEAVSYLRIIDFVYHSTLGLRVIQHERRCNAECRQDTADRRGNTLKGFKNFYQKARTRFWS